MSGQRFGKLTVIGYSGNNKWECRCDCGSVTHPFASNIRRGMAMSCGCVRHEQPAHNFQDITGLKFGRLLAIRRSSPLGVKNTKWECLCNCGKTTIVSPSKLKSGHTRSCGCLSIETVIKRVTTHGDTGSTTYSCWSAMLRRCFNPNVREFCYYGGRGITVCERWRRSYASFLKDMGPRPSGLEIDRIDNEGNYEPTNCRWTTKSQNCLNRRSSLTNRKK